MGSEIYNEGLLKNSLENITEEEINNIKKRINFYVNHFKISNKKKADEAKAKQLEFLLDLNTVLENELEERQETNSAFMQELALGL